MPAHPDQSSSLPIANIQGALVQQYYPSLNGLRGFAIIIVVASHLVVIRSAWYDDVFNGILGVNIFFVLSGFLITLLCLKEQAATGSLSLGAFYIRRALRVIPVAYLYLLVVLILNYAFQLHIAGFQFVGAALFVMNFNYFRGHDFSWMTAHYWSVSVEEQFYLAFPLLLKWNTKMYCYMLLIIAVLPVLCTLQEFYKPLNQGLPYYFSHYFIRFQSIAVGGLFAVLAVKGAFNSGWILRYKLAGNLVAISLMFLLRLDDYYSLKTTYVGLVIALLNGYLIISNIIPATDGVYRLLNTKWLSYIGVLSYSIYIWQEVFTASDARLPPFVRIFPYNLIGIAMVSWASYFLFERYFLKLKDRWVVKG